MAYDWHRPLERRFWSFTGLTLLAVVVGGLVLLVPPFFMQGAVTTLEGVRPYTALELEGRDIYIREGCNTCHSQQVRPFKAETDRYGPYSLAGEGVYDRPFLWGSRRTGPDLARVGGKYPDSWHWLHFENPRNIEPRSNMPEFAFLLERPMDLSALPRKLEVLRMFGTPYGDEEVANAAEDARQQAARIADSLRGDGIELDEAQARSEVIALIAYLQSLGRGVDPEAVQAASSTASSAETAR
jgi:cytochrome c oxidase cbb3-type subunit I/II